MTVWNRRHFNFSREAAPFGTPRNVAGLLYAVFKTGAFNRSATHPSGVRYWAGVPPATGPARAQRECGGIVHSQANWAERQGLRVSKRIRTEVRACAACLPCFLPLAWACRWPAAWFIPTIPGAPTTRAAAVRISLTLW